MIVQRMNGTGPVPQRDHDRVGRRHQAGLQGGLAPREEVEAVQRREQVEHLVAGQVLDVHSTADEQGAGGGDEREGPSREAVGSEEERGATA